MKQKNKYCTRFSILLLAVSYLIISSAHLFFAPNFQVNNISGNSSFSKTNSELVYNLIRTNRCLFNDNKNLKTYAGKAPSAFVVHLAYDLSDPVKNLSFKNTIFKADHHFSYLSNRTLRI